MANENDMNLHIRTTADTSGAEGAKDAVQEVVAATKEVDAVQPSGGGFDALIYGAKTAADAIEEVSDTAKDTGKKVDAALDPAEEAIRKMEESAAKAQEAIDDLNGDLGKMEGEQKQAAQAAESHAKSLKNIEAAGRALVVMQLAQHLQGMISSLRESTEAGGDLHDSMGHLNSTLEAVEGGVSVVTTGLSTFVSTGNPVLAVLAGISAGAQGVVAAYSDMRAAQERLEDSPRRLAEQIEFTRQKQRELGDEIRRQDAIQVYTDQAEALERQVRATERLNDLNQALNDAKVRMAAAEASIARSNGGDVALADTNVLASKFETQMNALNAQIREATDRATAARAAADEAFVKAKDLSEQTGVNIADVEALQNRATEAFNRANRADQALADLLVTTDAEREATIRETEAALASLNKSSAQISTDAKQAGDRLLVDLNQQMALIGQMVPKITGEAARPVVDQIKQVDAGLKQERANTVAAVQALTPKPTDFQAVEAPIKSLEESLHTMMDKIISAMTSVVATVQSRDGAISHLQEQINGLGARIR